VSSQKKTDLVVGRDCAVLDNGVIAVRRCFSTLNEPYTKVRSIPDYLAHVDHSLRIKKKKLYKKALFREEVRFNTLVRKLKDARRSLIVVFQGRDAAGKSGATQRIMQALDNDMKIFLSVPIGPPTDEELAHPYLWRFFKAERMPAFGQVRVFDRSWNERVLVEPVMSLTKPKAIQRSYAELRTFEWILESQGAIIVKFWMDLSKDEQNRRFKARAATKPWKMSPSDREARKHWDAYSSAANEMFFRTGTEFAPWFIVSSEDKWYSRVAVLQTINEVMKAELK